MDRERLGTFTQQLSQLRAALDYRAFAERYAIRRPTRSSGLFSDALQQAHQPKTPCATPGCWTPTAGKTVDNDLNA